MQFFTFCFGQEVDQIKSLINIDDFVEFIFIGVHLLLVVSALVLEIILLHLRPNHLIFLDFASDCLEWVNEIRLLWLQVVVVEQRFSEKRFLVTFFTEESVILVDALRWFLNSFQLFCSKKYRRENLTLNPLIF